MTPTLVNGIPAHPLLVHAVVILVPLAALCLLAGAVWPPLMRRLGLGTPGLALVALVLVPLTTGSGEWLEERVPETALVEEHAEMGGQLLPWVIGLFAVAVLVWLAYRAAARHKPRGPDRRSTSDRPGRVVWGVAIALSLVVSAGAVIQVYRVGDSGAQAVWQDSFSSTAD